MDNNFEDKNIITESDDIVDSTKKTKRIIIIVFSCMFAFMVLCLLIPGFQNLSFANKEIKDPTEDNTYIFYEPYEEGFDIFKYEEYMLLDRTIMYYDGTGIGTGVVEGNLNEFNPGVTVIYQMLQAAMRGDVDGYNACFGEDIEKKQDFTQQQIYKVTITNKSKSSTDGTYVFTVDYKIHENNGTFRQDMGSDEFRPLTVTVSNKSGKYLIEQMSGVISK